MYNFGSHAGLDIMPVFNWYYLYLSYFQKRNLPAKYTGHISKVPSCGVVIGHTWAWFNRSDKYLFQIRNDHALQWRHNGRNSVSNHQLHDCLLNGLFRRRSKKTSKLRVTGLCAGNSPGTGEFPAQMASTTENVSIWWRHHGRRNERTRHSAFHLRTNISCPTWCH